MQFIPIPNAITNHNRNPIPNLPAVRPIPFGLVNCSPKLHYFDLVWDVVQHVAQQAVQDVMDLLPAVDLIRKSAVKSKSTQPGRPSLGRRNEYQRKQATARCTSPVSVVTPQCHLVSGWGLKKRRSAPPYGLMAREAFYVATLRQPCSLLWHWGSRLYSDRHYFDKCYFDWNSRRQTRDYALHSHSPGSDSFICNGVSGVTSNFGPLQENHPEPPLLSFPSLHPTSPPALTDPVFFPFLSVVFFSPYVPFLYK